MKRISIGLIALFTTFIIGVSVVVVWTVRHNQLEKTRVLQLKTSPEQPTTKTETEETPEAKAVRMAEEFIAQNGCTDLPPSRDKISYETIEWTDNVDELLEWRRNTLERKAYGIFYHKRLGGWIVVFQYKKSQNGINDKTGRAVTMDKNFKSLRVEHQDFILDKVDKKF